MIKNILVAVLVIAIGGFFTIGCDVNESQIKAISQNAGLAASITWIAYDNPSDEAKTLVEVSMDIILENIGNVESGKTYMEILYPKIEEFVRSDEVPDQYEPLVLAGSMSFLNGIDLLFLTYPEWKVQEGVALGVVKSFILGANNGLALSNDDPRIQQAKVMSARRAKVFQD